jgi:glutamyl-tRNA synthetase
MAPSPTGSPHVGLVRTALFNWAFARHHGGTFVFRVEDTDKERSTDESYAAILDLFRWLGLDWDEGPEVGGPHAPYRQSERSEIYADVLTRLRDGGFTYDCYCTNDEVAERRKASGSKILGYDGFCRSLTDEQRRAFVDEGRQPVVRFRMPDGEITFEDLARGEVSFHADLLN